MNPKLLKFFLDAGALLGIALFIFGLYQVWHPLAPLVGGLLLTASCFFGGYDAFRKTTIERFGGGR
jgi:hypothetical protein